MIDVIRFLFVAAMTVIAFIPGFPKSLNGAGIDKTDFNIVRLAFAITFLSDFFIIILFQNLIGVSFFCFVHAVYFYRHMRILQKPGLGVAILIFVGLSVAGINTFCRNLYLLSGVYAFCLISAVVSSCFLLKRGKGANKLMMFYGMLCFFMCDVFVAVFNTASGLVSDIALQLIWVFYVPALILLAFSAKKWNPKK